MYIRPRADTNTAVKDLNNTISKCKNDDPNTVSIVAGYFNKENLESTRPEYEQYVICLSRYNRILYHCYCNVKKLPDSYYITDTVMLIPQTSC